MLTGAEVSIDVARIRNLVLEARRVLDHSGCRGPAIERIHSRLDEVIRDVRSLEVAIR